MTGEGSSRACRSLLLQPATTRLWSSESTLGDDLEVSAWAEDGTVMGIRHKACLSTGCSSIPRPCSPRVATD